MRTKTVLVMAAIAAVALIPAQASAATLRVVTADKTVFGAGAPIVGSATAFVDSKGKVRKLARKTALGQLVAAMSYAGRGLTSVYSPGMGAYVTMISGTKAPSTGYWSLFVNNQAAMLGASSLILKASDEVVWILDNDYVKKGPYAFDLDASTNADGTVTFTGTKFGGAKPTAAADALITINTLDGVVATRLDSTGKLTVTPAYDVWSASIGSVSGVIGSQILTG